MKNRRREPGRDGKIDRSPFRGHRQDGNVAAGRISGPISRRVKAPRP